MAKAPCLWHRAGCVTTGIGISSCTPSDSKASPVRRLAQREALQTGVAIAGVSGGFGNSHYQPQERANAGGGVPCATPGQRPNDIGPTQLLQPDCPPPVRLLPLPRRTTTTTRRTTTTAESLPPTHPHTHHHHRPAPPAHATPASIHKHACHLW